MQFVVVTTVNSPTNIFTNLEEKTDVTCLVIGDKKTPNDWAYPGVNYINIEKQEQLGYSVTKHLPYSHYSRKNLGYVFAKLQGATSIIDTDDDNYPIKGWSYPVKSTEYYITKKNQGFLNIYEYFSSEFFWPRGFPLDEIIPTKGKLNSSILQMQHEIPKVGIWQGLVNGEPDFDAIYRLTHETKDFSFKEKNPIVLSKGCYCPINSQNTFFIEELFPLLYLPITVAFRFTDILRGYIAQVISFHKGYGIGFCAPNVVQVRNKHNLFRDFQDELTTYQYSKQAVEVSESEVSDSESIASNIHRIYKSLARNGIVKDQEIPALDAFLKDIT